MRDFFVWLLQSLVRNLAVVAVGTLILGLLGWAVIGLTLLQSLTAALVLCVLLWLLVRFLLNSGEI